MIILLNQNEKNIKKFIIFNIFFCFFTTLTYAQTYNERNNQAAQIYTEFSIEIIGAKGAVQVSQSADMAQMKYSKIIIAQNEEMIALLKELLLKPTATQAAQVPTGIPVKTK